jgi:hypothetical protein
MVRNRVLGLLSAVALLAGVAVTIGGSANAASPTLLPLFKTTTTVSASPNIVVSSVGDDAAFTPEPSTVTATVTESPLPNGLLITPLGKVTFTAADNYGDHLALGTVSLKGCLLTLNTCTASVTSSAFFVAAPDLAQENGTAWTVTASYAGDAVATGSSGSGTVTSLAGDSTTCATDQGCNLFSYNGDDSAAIQISLPCLTNCEESGPNNKVSHGTLNANNTNTTGEVWTGFGSPQLGAPVVNPCQAAGDDVDGAGDSINGYTEFPTDLVNAANPADITYYLTGDEALAQGPSSSFCYGSVTPFTQFDGSPAPFDATTEQYVGVLPDCSSGDLPCSFNLQYTPSGGWINGSAQWSMDILTDTDPTGGKH